MIFHTESCSSFSSVSGLKDRLAASEIPVKSSIGLSVTFSVDFRQIKEPVNHVRHHPEQFKAVKPKGTLNMNDNCLLLKIAI